MGLTPLVLDGTAVRLEPLGLHHLDGLTEVGLDPTLWTTTTTRVTSREEMRSYVMEALAE